MSRVTPAELAALQAFATYGTVKQAAHALGKSPRTVEQQLDSARRRLGVSKSMTAVLRLRLGLGDE